MFISEAYLDSNFPDDDSRLNLPGYNLVTADNPNNAKRGGVCVYFKESLAFCLVMSFYLMECLDFEIFIHNRKVYVVSSSDHLVKLRTSLIIIYLPSL